METNQKTIKDIIKKIQPILRKFEVKKAGIFGSYARGEHTPESDIDILVEFDGNKSLYHLSSLHIELEENLHKKVDINTYKAIHLPLKEYILQDIIHVKI